MSDQESRVCRNIKNRDNAYGKQVKVNNSATANIADTISTIHRSSQGVQHFRLSRGTLFFVFKLLSD
jgi:hypothetical protein